MNSVLWVAQYVIYVYNTSAYMSTNYKAAEKYITIFYSIIANKNANLFFPYKAS